MPETTPDAIGKWLQERCQKESLSLRQAAAKTGLSHGTIAQVMNGTNPSVETIRKLACAFGGNGQRRSVLEDKLLGLAGYRSRRPEGEEPSESMARLLDKLSQFSEPQLKIMARFADFLTGMEAE